MKNEKSFLVCNNGLFQFDFPNGYRISVGIGANHYCDNRDLSDEALKDYGCLLRPLQRISSDNCEVAFFNKDGNFAMGWPGQCEGDQVGARISVDKFHKIIAWIYQQS